MVSNLVDPNRVFFAGGSGKKFDKRFWLEEMYH